MDALALASGGYEDALGLGPEEYEKTVLLYDIKRHRLVPKYIEGSLQGAPVAALQRGIPSVRCAKIIFLKINKGL